MGKILYVIAAGLFKIYFKLYYHWKIKGFENIPVKGSLVVVANHVSFLDPPVVGCIMNRQVHFMAKEELFKNPLLSWALQKIGTFPVKRGRPDRGALKRALDILRNGEVLGIFPEGTRHKQGRLGRAKSGAVMIPIKTKSPILPVGIKYEARRLKVSIGQPFTLNEYYERKLSREDLKKAGDCIMEKIQAELSKI